MREAQSIEPPHFQKWIEWLGWCVFFVMIFMIVSSLVVQSAPSAQSASSNWNRFGRTLICMFPWLLSIAIALSSGCTFAAATRFGSRYATIRSQIDRLASSLQNETLQANTENKHLVIARPRSGRFPAADLQLTAMNKYLPQPYYGLESCKMYWSIPAYLDLLLQEQSSARSAAGRLAAALGGAFAGGVLAFGRLIQFLAV